MHSPGGAALCPAPSVVVGRQPIVDRGHDVVGFELLYRSAHPDADRPTGEQMTADVVLGTLSIGVDRLVGDKTMFCNADRGALTGATPITLPPRRTVIEVLESVTLDAEVVSGCRDLVDQGFTLALDDFEWRAEADELLGLASIVKIDVQALSRDQVVALAERCRPYGVRLLAEKVETRDDVDWALGQGFDLFQGYAIERPDLVHGQTVAASRLTHMQLAVTLLTEEIDFDELESLLRREPGLVVQVLHMASLGADHGLRRQVRTVREALVLLGSTRIRQWVALTLLSGQTGGSLDGLATSLVRARMCEVLAERRAVGDPEFAFTAGLLSSLDLLLGVPLEQLGGSLEISSSLKAAALEGAGPTGALVSEVAAYQDRLVSARATPDDPGVDGLAGDLDAAAAAGFAWAMPYVSTLTAASSRAR